MISILMATYNGERFIHEQIDSLLDQTYQDFKLYISDDASTDKTFQIISRYAKDNPNKIFVSQREKNSGDAKFNFIDMMLEHRDDYLMLCDQDDVWFKDKIEITLSKMKEMELMYGIGTPILVHTDLEVVDNNLKTISPSFKEAMNADYTKTELRNQVIQNTLTGCTAMYNRALADLIKIEPRYMVMHDWWLILIASAFGKIGSDERQTVLYRQHNKNEIGAKDVRTMRYKLDRALHYRKVKKAINITYQQADSFLRTYFEMLSTDQRKLLAAYSDIPNHFKFIRIYRVFSLGTHKNGFSRRVAHIIFI